MVCVRFTKISPDASQRVRDSIALHRFANPNVKARGHGHESPLSSAVPFAFVERFQNTRILDWRTEALKARSYSHR